MGIDLLDFVQKSKRLAKQAFRETENRLKYMAEIREVLELDRDDFPDYTTIYKSFTRLKMWV